MQFNKKTIANNFNKAAQNYQNNAHLQQQVAQNLVQNHQNIIKNAKNILDLGSGSGFIAQLCQQQNLLNLQQNFINCDIAINMLKTTKQKSINCDIEFLPIKPDKIDLIISSLSFQWLNNFNQTLNQIHQILPKNGYFICAFLSKNTLKEIKFCCQQLNIPIKINNFLDPKQINCNFNNIKITTQTIKKNYNNVIELINSMKKIGAKYQNTTQSQSISPQQIRDLNNFYLQKFSYRSKIRSNWEISYIFAQKTNV